MVLKWHFCLPFLHGGYHFLLNGLERSLLMSQTCFSVFSMEFCRLSVVDGLERSFSCCLWSFSRSLKQTLTHFYTRLWLNLTLCWLDGLQWSASVSWSLQCKRNGLERNLLSSAGVGAWCCHDLPASHRRNIPTLFWILSGIPALGSHSSPVHEETST